MGSGQTQKTGIPIDREHILPPKEVRQIVSADHYLVIYASNRRHIIRQTMTNMERMLGPQFVRTHRQHLINVEHILSFDAHAREVQLKDGSLVPVGRRRVKAVRSAVERSRITI